MREMHREPEVPEARVPVVELLDWPCKDYLKGTCTNPLCEKWHLPECLFYKSENGSRFGEKCSYTHRPVDEQPSKKSKKNGDKSAVAMLKITRQLGCVSQDMEPPKSTTNLRKSSNILKPIRCVRFTEAVSRYANIRDQNPSRGIICQVILITASTMHQNLRISFRKRRNGKSDVPVKQRGSGPKITENSRRKIKQQSSHLRKIGACLCHQPQTRGKSRLRSVDAHDQQKGF